MNSKFSSAGSRISIILSSLLLIGALLFPLWKIDLTAPQYPEGLTLKIWAGKLTGNIDTVNGLNHYIGMRKLVADEFVEFKILPGLLLFFSLFGLIVGLVNNKKVLYVWMTMFIIFAAISMLDFYYWEYNYGHSLDPTAPIQVPGMAYQPPFLGYKQMLNFGAFSIPDIGGWFFIACGVFMFLITLIQWKSGKKQKMKTSAAAAVSVLLCSIFSVTSCNNQVRPINYGKDECQYCKMTIIDKKFGVEIVTKKGKAFKLDDVRCAENFVKEKTVDKEEIKEIYVCNYKMPGEMILLNQSFFVKNESLGSPMGGNTAAFSTNDEAMGYIKTNGGELVPFQKFDLVK